MDLDTLIADESRRQAAFPVTREGAFLAHAAVCPLPAVAAEAMRAYVAHGAQGRQEGAWSDEAVAAARARAAALLGCDASEIALLGPTSLGLSLVAAGLPWEPHDEVVYYAEDYPANVYPWTGLRARGVRPVALHPAAPGAITWDVVETALTERTKLVALATAHFLSGYRIDIDTIGRHLRARGILFCLDAIQTLGAFPVPVEHVDFLSADSHKWLLGPAGAGVFYVKSSRFDILRPALLGSWNVYSPQFIAQDDIRFYSGARRYEPGILNIPGIVGMAASMQLLLDLGVDTIARRILELRRRFLEAVQPLGYRIYGDEDDSAATTGDACRSGIVSLYHPDRDPEPIAQRLAEAQVTVSLRQNREGRALLRFSPHCYNTHDELSRAAALMR